MYMWQTVRPRGSNAAKTKYSLWLPLTQSALTRTLETPVTLGIAVAVLTLTSVP